MPPTNANALLPSTTATSPTTPSPTNSKDTGQQQLRPPLYNAEDYASALRALFTTSLSLPQQPPPPTSLILEHASTHPPLIPGQGLIDMNKHTSIPPNKQHQPEMGMKKFINGSELLFKLEADLRSAFPSFTQEFISGDSDGISCILDALRTVHEALDHVNGLREQRKLVLDERSCIQCLHLTLRNLDSISKLLSYPHGLYPIMHCTVSTNTSTRILALEILTSICEQQASNGGGTSDAFAKVSEAVSTLRLRLGEPIRCKVLVGAISSAAAGVFQAAGIRFLRSFVASAPNARFKVYLQVELEEAGFHVDVIRKSAELSPARESRLVIQELDEWDHVVLDVDTVVRQNSQLRNSVATLQQEIATLKDKIKKQDHTHSSSSSSTTPIYATPSSSSNQKYTKKHPNQQKHHASSSHHHNHRLLSSTPIQTITTPVDSEEEAEQIHQILEDLHNIVNNEMLQTNGSSTASTTTTSEIVPHITRPHPPPFSLLPRSSNNNQRPSAHSEPNLFSEVPDDDNSTLHHNSSDTENNAQAHRVKDVVQQLENSNVLLFSTTTLPNFNTGPLASKFANFKSSKLDGNGWGESPQDTGSSGGSNGKPDKKGRTRVKSLENLDNFTLKWKYPVVVGEKGSAPAPPQQQTQQPNSLMVLQDYRMNRFGNNSKQNGGKEESSNSRKNSPSNSGGGLFSKHKKQKQQQQQQAQAHHQPHHHPVHQYPQKTFQMSLVGNSSGSKQRNSTGDDGKVTNLMSFNDLGGGSGGSNSLMMLERVLDLPSGMY